MISSVWQNRTKCILHAKITISPD